MKHITRLALAMALAGPLGGCTSFLIQQQGKPWPGHYADCPKIYTATRMEFASLAWAVSDATRPPDACLAHYHAQAEQDSFYRDINRGLAPFYALSLPADLLLDTLVLPFAAMALAEN